MEIRAGLDNKQSSRGSMSSLSLGYKFSTRLNLIKLAHAHQINMFLTSLVNICNFSVNGYLDLCCFHSKMVNSSRTFSSCPEAIIAFLKRINYFLILNKAVGSQVSLDAIPFYLTLEVFVPRGTPTGFYFTAPTETKSVTCNVDSYNRRITHSLILTSKITILDLNLVA